MFTTRAGGVSGSPYAASGGGGGFNLGRHVGDEPAAVDENRRRLERMLGVTVEWMDQVHGRDLCVITEPTGRHAAATADALVIGPGVPRIAPGVLVADCVPVVLATESGSHRAAVHVGRKGMMLGILGAAVERLGELAREAVFAVAGPHICGRCYEVSAELFAEADALGAGSTTRWGTPGVDLLAGIRRQLDGVPFAVVPGCTLEDERFYSYRRDGRTGRCAGVAVVA
ncbi:MAG TPA: polyphenol oxidase family protein [Actinomycetaceae bacterium]|nr:polyphenol oxidase family protein [Actinomycetaceae bacterium]